MRLPDSHAFVPPLQPLLASRPPCCLALHVQGCQPPVTVSSLGASLSALVVLASKANVAETLGVLPVCCSPHPGGHRQLGQTSFPVTNTTPESFYLWASSVHMAEWGSRKCRRIHVPRSNPHPMDKSGSW